MTVPQIILFLDTSGSLRAEAPGRNGQRRKIDLPIGQTRSDRLAQLEALLSDLEAQNTTIKAENSRLAMAAKIERPDPARVREAQIATAQAQRLKEWNAYLDTLSPSAREFHLSKQAVARDIADAKSASAARQIWLRTAKEHDVLLANKVITDATRRPGRLFKLAGVPGSFSPRTFTGDTSKSSYIAKSRNTTPKTGKTIPGIKVTL